MPEWTELGTIEEFEGSSQVCLEVGGVPLVVFKTDDGYRVMANVCPHAGLPLGDGERRGDTITCPYHGYTYSIRNGADLDDPEFGQPATMYPVRIEGKTLQADLDPGE